MGNNIFYLKSDLIAWKNFAEENHHFPINNRQWMLINFLYSWILTILFVAMDQSVIENFIPRHKLHPQKDLLLHLQWSPSWSYPIDRYRQTCTSVQQYGTFIMCFTSVRSCKATVLTINAHFQTSIKFRILRSKRMCSLQQAMANVHAHYSPAWLYGISAQCGPMGRGGGHARGLINVSSTD